MDEAEKGDLMSQTTKAFFDPAVIHICFRCDSLDIKPNKRAYDLSREYVCDGCAEEVFEENGQLGVGA